MIAKAVRKKPAAGPVRGFMHGAAGVSLFAATAAFAAANAPDGIRLAAKIVPAAFGDEAVAAQYVIAEPTPLYVSPFIDPGTVNNATLMPGQAVDALVKAKDYDWILVGKDGVGIGYVPISRLSSRSP
jgi:hypothetical protein